MKRPTLTLQIISLSAVKAKTKVFLPESDWGGQLLKGFDLHSEEDFPSNRRKEKTTIYDNRC